MRLETEMTAAKKTEVAVKTDGRKTRKWTVAQRKAIAKRLMAARKDHGTPRTWTDAQKAEVALRLKAGREAKAAAALKAAKASKKPGVRVRSKKVAAA